MDPKHRTAANGARYSQLIEVAMGKPAIRTIVAHPCEEKLVYFAGAESPGVALGAHVSNMLTSRADGALSRAASCAIGQLFVHEKTSQSP